MSKLSDNQRGILKAASKKPTTDVREFMKHIKSPAIIDKVVESMLKHGFIIEDPNADGVAYVISDAGFAAIGKKRPEAPAEEAPPQDAHVEGEESSAPEAEAAAPVKKSAPKRKREGKTKKQTLFDMLSREEGATNKQLREVTGWQKHSVQGAISTLNKELVEGRSMTIVSAKGEGEDRVYKIVPHEPAQESPAKEEETAE